MNRNTQTRVDGGRYNSAGEETVSMERWKSGGWEREKRRCRTLWRRRWKVEAESTMTIFASVRGWEKHHDHRLRVRESEVERESLGEKLEQESENLEHVKRETWNLEAVFGLWTLEAPKSWVGL